MHNSVNIVKDALDAEADAYLLKNTTQKELLQTLNRITEDCTYYSQDILPLIKSYKQVHQMPHPIKDTLTQREREILKLIGEELNNQEIADTLFISKQTVETHRKNIMHKIECKSVVGLIKYAIHIGLVQ
jgi:DNA-binding NarL/FixJ family response regulator